jgi:ribA/ribD-fused uncharacterized protein
MRIGEMERDVLIAHGTMNFFQESMMKRSDGTKFWVCNGCGTIPITNESQDLFVCPMCDGPVNFQGETNEDMTLVLPVKKSRVTFSKVEMPYAMKLLDQELTTYMNAGFRFLTEKHARKFREPTEMSLELLLDLGAQENLIVEPVEPVQEAKPEQPDDEDRPSDSLEDDQPAKNDVGTEPASYQPVVDFSSQSKEWKELRTDYKMNLVLDGITYPSVEHYFQAMKFPTNPALQEEIRTAKTAGKAKTLGRKGSPMREDWETYRLTVMEKALREKFSDRHPELQTLLRSTGTAILRDTSPLDNFWGIGRKKIGLNHLGRLLMKLRDEEGQSGGQPHVQEQAEEEIKIIRYT